MSIPDRFHNEVLKEYPNAVEVYKELIRGKGSDQLGDWPEWCYVPMAGAYAAVTGGGRLEPERARDIAKVAAVMAWRPHRAVVKLEGGMGKSEMEAVSEEVKREDLETSVWCTFLDLGEYHGKRFGAFVHLEYDINNGETEFRGLLVDEDMECQQVIVDLVGGLEEGVRSVIQEAYEQAQKKGETLNVEVGMTEFAAKRAAPLVAATRYVAMKRWEPDPPERPRRTAEAAEEKTIYRIKEE
jgi:hypothetical protein